LCGHHPCQLDTGQDNPPQDLHSGFGAKFKIPRISWSMHAVSFSFSKHIDCNAFNPASKRSSLRTLQLKAQRASLSSGRCAILRTLNGTTCRTPNLEHWLVGTPPYLGRLNRCFCSQWRLGNEISAKLLAVPKHVPSDTLCH
jgi:hypothetical protein